MYNWKETKNYKKTTFISIYKYLKKEGSRGYFEGKMEDLKTFEENTKYRENIQKNGRKTKIGNIVPPQNSMNETTSMKEVAFIWNTKWEA